MHRIENENGVVPIEVKAGNSASASFNRMLERGLVKVGSKFTGGNAGRVGKKITLPHYMAMFVCMERGKPRPIALFPYVRRSPAMGLTSTLKTNKPQNRNPPISESMPRSSTQLAICGCVVAAISDETENHHANAAAKSTHDA